jgi:hypothetical protein
MGGEAGTAKLAATGEEMMVERRTRVGFGTVAARIEMVVMRKVEFETGSGVSLLEVIRAET